MYKGKVQRGYDVSFTVSPDGKQVSKVQARVLESCTGSSTTSTVTFYMDGPFPVGADGTLVAEEQDPDTKYTSKFTAAFAKDGTASGTLIQKGAMFGTVCTTYELKWDASRQ